MNSLHEQSEKLTLSSRAFYNDKFPIFAELVTSMFGYEMVLPMNTGAEGVETALKLARKWGYEKKKISKDEVPYMCSFGVASIESRNLNIFMMSSKNLVMELKYYYAVLVHVLIFLLLVIV